MRTAAGLAVAAAGGFLIKRSGSNVRGWLVAQAARMLGPDLSSREALDKLIAEDRARGPACPPKKLLKEIDFSDSREGEVRLFRVVPRNGISSPLKLLYLHGGAFLLDLQEIQWNLIAGMSRRIGAEIVAPIYPLGPEAGWRETMAAVQQVYADMAGQYGTDNIVIFGDSAGGGLALLLAQWLRDNGKPLPAALVLFSPALDLSASGEDLQALERRDPSLTIELIRNVARMWAGDVSPDDPRVSPLFGDHSGLPPTLVFSGTREILNSDAHRLAAANPDVLHKEYPDMVHVWPVGPLREGQQAMDEAAAFIRWHTLSAPDQNARRR